MRKIILFMHMSLDGFIGGSNGEMDWVTMDDPEMGKFLITDLLKTVDSMILGRVLFHEFEQYWPAYANDPNTSPDEAEFGHWIDMSPKIVFSSTLENVEWQNSQLVRVNDDNEIAEKISQLKNEPGGDMVMFGGARMVQTLNRLGLIDEYRLKVEPIVLGHGLPLFQDLNDRIKLKLVKSKIFKSGVVGLYYQTLGTE
jgi:dihydrofolate reductase